MTCGVKLFVETCIGLINQENKQRLIECAHKVLTSDEFDELVTVLDSVEYSTQEVREDLFCESCKNQIDKSRLGHIIYPENFMYSIPSYALSHKHRLDLLRKKCSEWGVTINE